MRLNILEFLQQLEKISEDITTKDNYIYAKLNILEILRQLEKTPEYIKIEDLKHGYSYKIYALNAFAGIWIENFKGFLIARYKCGDKPYPFIEYHWDHEDGGTAKPFELIEKSPFKIDGDPWNLPDEKKQAVLEYLEELERRHPLIPGYDSVEKRKLASIRFEERLKRGRNSNRTPIWKILKDNPNLKI